MEDLIFKRVVDFKKSSTNDRLCVVTQQSIGVMLSLSSFMPKKKREGGSHCAGLKPG